MNKGAHEETASQWGGSIDSFTSSEWSSESNEAAADAKVVDVEPDTLPQHAYDQPRDVGVRSRADDSSERNEDGKYAHRQPRAGETEYAALQRLVGTLQETLLRMNAGQQAVAQQMQHDFTLQLQLA